MQDPNAEEATPQTGPRYKVAGKFYDNWQMHEDGAEVTYKGEPGDNLIPINAEAKARKKAAATIKPVGPLSADERRELEELRAKTAAP